MTSVWQLFTYNLRVPLTVVSYEAHFPEIDTTTGTDTGSDTTTEKYQTSGITPKLSRRTTLCSGDLSQGYPCEMSGVQHRWNGQRRQQPATPVAANERARKTNTWNFFIFKLFFFCLFEISLFCNISIWMMVLLLFCCHLRCLKSLLFNSKKVTKNNQRYRCTNQFNSLFFLPRSTKWGYFQYINTSMSRRLCHNYAKYDQKQHDNTLEKQHNTQHTQSWS